MITVKVYLRDKELEFKCNEVEVDRLTDELNIRIDKTLIARFFIKNIAGYEIIREDG